MLSENIGGHLKKMPYFSNLLGTDKITFVSQAPTVDVFQVTNQYDYLDLCIL